jgi:Leucine-rich repeat (LRR) protein
MPLGQLPALQQLVLSHNPIRQVPASNEKPQDYQQAADSAAHSYGDTNNTTHARGTGSCGGIFEQLKQLDLSHTKVAQAGQLLPLLQLRQLAELRLVGTPLAARCWSGLDPVKVTKQCNFVPALQHPACLAWLYAVKKVLHGTLLNRQLLNHCPTAI